MSTFYPDALFDHAKVVVEDRCVHCRGTGIEWPHPRALCKACGGTGHGYTVYHDGSMFARE